MKKLIVISFMFVFSAQINAQNYLSYDSIHKHEISVSVLPLVNILSGSFTNSAYVNFNFGYKYYLKSKYVLRTAFVIFPINTDPFSGIVMYDRTVGNRNVFMVRSHSQNKKIQFNLGMEKVYKINRLMHGFGVDAFINQARATYQAHYFYRYLNQNFLLMQNDTTNYSVDSLGYSSSEKKVGIGLQVFYSIRYKISKRFYLSATIGPSFNYSFVNVERYEARTKETLKYKATQFDFPNVGFISDISICFRL